MSTKHIRLSVLDQSPIRKGVTPEQAVQETITLAKHAEALGNTTDLCVKVEGFSARGRSEAKPWIA